MQPVSFRVEGLFGRFDYDIPLKGSRPYQKHLPMEQEVAPSIIILYGANGSGKTTVLRMIDGFLRLDFNVFRSVPFSFAELRFNQGQAISVRPESDKERAPLIVEFDDLRARLHPLRTGPYDDDDSEHVSEFRNMFFSATESISFSLIDTRKFMESYGGDDLISRIHYRYGTAGDASELYLTRDPSTGEMRVRSARLRHRDTKTDTLADQVRDFVNEAQVDYRSFFASEEPDLFARILRKLTGPEELRVDRGDLLTRLNAIQEEEAGYHRLGLQREHWEYDELAKILHDDSTGSDALNVIAAYVEVLESRHDDRKLIAERLFRFEDLMSEFYSNLRFFIDPKRGFRIETLDGKELHEDQLSSGQYHLLFLMVSALTTKRRGTVLAIDEPELSMHIAWQRKLIRALIECAYGAEPQFIFATHSPDVAADYRESMIQLGSSSQA